MTGLVWMSFGVSGVRGAEAGLFQACCTAGGPTSAGAHAYLGRGRLRIRRRRSGGMSAGGGRGRRRGGAGSSRLYRVSRGDDLDVESAQYFVNSSLSPVLLFRRRVESVADVLKEIRRYGFTQSRSDALCRYWSAACRHDTSRSAWFLSVGDGCYGTAEWVWEAGRHCSSRDTWLLSWANWLWEDLGSRPCAWL